MALTDHVRGIVHEPTQTDGVGLDLTVDSIARVTAPAQVDFGGGELEPAATERHEPVLRDPGDDYGWWDLDRGTYLISYNEVLESRPDETLVLQTRDAVRERGAFHPTVIPTESHGLAPMPFSVGDGGIQLKENARVSTLVTV